MSWPVRIATLAKGGRLFPQASAGWDFVRGAYKNASGYIRTNGLKASDDFTAAAWGKNNGASFTSDQATAPDGTLTADLYTGANNYAYFNQAFSGGSVSGVPYTASVYVKAGSIGQIAIFVGDVTSTNGVQAQFFPTGAGAFNALMAVGTGGNARASIEALPNGWFRCSLTGSYTGTAAYTTISNSSAGPGTLYFWRGQFELGGYPSTAIQTPATSTASVTTYTSTNPADVGNMTFTRASTGYAEDAQGNLILFGPNVPRITNKGVLIEESRTNLALNSSMGASWGSNPNDTVTPNAVTAPDGTATGTKVTINSGATNNIYRAFSVTAGTTYTGSLYLKQGAGAPYQAVLLFGASGAYRVWLNTQTGALSGASLTGVWTGASATVTAAAGGWFRVALTATVVTDTSVTLETDQASTSGNYMASPGDYFYCWGAQLEAGSFATSYIPTTSASVTRPADVFYYSGLSALSALTVAAQVSANHTPVGNEFPVSLDDGTGNNRLQWFHGTASPNSMLPRVVTGGIAANPTDIANGVPNSGSSTQALTAASGRSMAAANGVLSASGGSPSGVPPYTYLRVGANEGGLAWNNYLQRLAIYPFAASDAQLQSISSGNF